LLAESEIAIAARTRPHLAGSSAVTGKAVAWGIVWPTSLQRAGSPRIAEIKLPE
jgi:hypothetical protein